MTAFEDLRVGLSAERSRVITESDVRTFAQVSGDDNPIHLDEAVAQKSVFGTRIAHGMLSVSYISAVLGRDLPGPGSIYMSQTLRFTKPVKIGETVTARVEVLEVVTEKRRVRMKTTCVNQNGEIVIDGEALMMVPAAS